MQLSKNQLHQAVDAEIISETQYKDLIEFSQKFQKQGPQFNLTNVLYYFGGLIAIGALSVFMGLSWEIYGPIGIFILSLSYFILALGLTHSFDSKQYPVPAGICATLAISLTPLIVYSAQKLMGLWPDDTLYYEYHYVIKWHWLFMELATLMTGILLAFFYRYPFIMLPIAITLWYMSMDITRMLSDSYTFELAALISLYFGLASTLLAVWVDLRSSHSKDYAFWLYIFGVFTFWMGLTCQDSQNELSKLIYFGINLLLILVGVVLTRRIFVVFGGLGCFLYLGHLAYEVFKYSYLFPIALTALGLGIMYLGILWQKHGNTVTQYIRGLLPDTVKKLLDAKEKSSLK